VFGQALIKKRRYWPKHVDGDAVAHHFESKEVGDIDSWPGVMDGVSFHIFGMKEPDYVMSIMSTFGTLQQVGEGKKRLYMDSNRHKVTKNIYYPEPIANHFDYRDAVDSNNHDRMSPITLEETWKMTRWPCRVFQFLLAVSEVNVRLAMHRIFGMEDLSQQAFRKKLAGELLENPYLDVIVMPTVNLHKRNRTFEHTLVSIPPWHTFDKTGKLVKCATRYIGPYRGNANTVLTFTIHIAVVLQE